MCSADLGAAIARCLKDSGFSVALADTGEAGPAELMAELGDCALYIRCDVRYKALPNRVFCRSLRQDCRDRERVEGAQVLRCASCNMACGRRRAYWRQRQTPRMSDEDIPRACRLERQAREVAAH